MPVKILTFSPTTTVRRISGDGNGRGNSSGRDWKSTSTFIGFSVIIQPPLIAILLFLLAQTRQRLGLEAYKDLAD
jgi:hypothetical protein